MSMVTLVGSDEENRSAACNASGQTVSRIYLGTQVDLAAIPSIAEGGAGNVSGLFLLDLRSVLLLTQYFYLLLCLFK